MLTDFNFHWGKDKINQWHYHFILFFIFCIGTNCTPPAIDDFPGDFFTREQRQAGAIAFHITVSLYLFLALAVVCDKYFVPAVEKISQGKMF